MDTSVFTAKSKPPAKSELAEALGKSAALWSDLAKHISKGNTEAYEEWNFSKNFGWNCRIRDKKRVIVYLMPGKGIFRASMVFGAKASENALKSKICDNVKEIIKSAKVYAEGRGFRIEVNIKNVLNDIKTLIDIKLSN